MANVNLTGAIAIRALDASGDPVSGAKLYVYEAGTTTPVTTYADQGGVTPNAHPVVADSSGAFGDAFLPAGEYKIDLTTSGGTSLPGYPADDVAIGITEIAAANVTLADAGTYWDAANVEAWSQELGALMPAGAIVGTTDEQTLTNKTLTAPVLNGDLTGTGIINDQTFEAATAVTAATSSSIRDYVQSQLLTIGLQGVVTHDFATDGGTFILNGITEDDNDLEIDLEGVSATTLTIEYSTNNGSSWGSALTLGTTMSTESGVLLVRGIADSTRKTIAQMTYGDNSTAAASVVRLDGSAADQDALRIKTLTAGRLIVRRVAGASVELSDPLWDDVLLLVQGGFADGTGGFGNPDYVDISPVGRTIFSTGQADSSSEQGVITLVSIPFDGDGDGLAFTHSTALDPGAGPYSMECAIYMDALPASRYALFSCYGPAGTDECWYTFVDSSGNIGLLYALTPGGAETTITFAAGLTTGTEYRIAIVIDGSGNVSCNVNGAAVGSAVALAGSIAVYPDTYMRFGYLQTGAFDFSGYANRIRITGAERTDFSRTGLFLTR
jgi:hypothetical protein